MKERLDHTAAMLDWVNRITGRTIRWLALAMVLVQFIIVVLRYVFGISDIALSESVLYMHGFLFMIGAGYTFLHDGHVRVDFFYQSVKPRTRDLIDLVGAVFFVIPSMAVFLWFTWPFIRSSWRILEGPQSVGGIPALFLLKSLIPAFCVLLMIQALAHALRALGRILWPAAGEGA